MVCKESFAIARKEAEQCTPPVGITPEFIEPGRPQQNARHERMHLTLKRETARPPKRTRRAQQGRFSSFRVEFKRRAGPAAPLSLRPLDSALLNGVRRQRISRRHLTSRFEQERSGVVVRLPSSMRTGWPRGVVATGR